MYSKACTSESSMAFEYYIVMSISSSFVFSDPSLSGSSGYEEVDILRGLASGVGLNLHTFSFELVLTPNGCGL